ncbi:hypothetical protein ACROYT_G019367 [Oculina patagonica]
MGFSLNETSPIGMAKGRDVDPNDATWILTSAFIILAMQSGFGLLESGMASRKNETNIMVKNAIDVLCGGLAYWMFGFALSFGESEYSNSFCGIGYFLVRTDNVSDEGWLHAKYFFQLSFATTATTIVSGAMAERVYLKAYTVFAFFNVLTHCLPAHWVWDKKTGWLFKMGFVDVAGASVVHIVGGVTGLIATMMLKPRHKRFAADGEAKLMEISSPSNVLLGTFMLWWGWLGFNCGSTFGVSNGKWKLAARSAVCTLNASIGGGCFALFYSYIFKENTLNISIFSTGVISGLVSITAICAIARPWEAIVIGLIGSMIACLGCKLLEKHKIDDPVSCVPTHAFAGIWAVIAVGLFAEKNNILKRDADNHGVFKGGSIRFLGIQVLGVVVIICWTVVISYTTLYVIDKLMGLRVTLLQEIIGADQHEHGIADINDPEGLSQIRKHLPRGTKIRLAQTRQRIYTIKQPRHRNVYSFSTSNANRLRDTSEANGNATFEAPFNKETTLRKRFRRSQTESSPTIKRPRQLNSRKAAEKHANCDFVRDCIDVNESQTDDSFASDSEHEHNFDQTGHDMETMSTSQVHIVMYNGLSSTLEQTTSRNETIPIPFAFKENARET